MTTAALVWLDERAAAAAAARQTPFLLPPSGFGVGAVRRLVEVLDDRCHGIDCLCDSEPVCWQRGCPVSHLPAAAPWRPDREAAR
jgi:hypothetical protein